MSTCTRLLGPHPAIFPSFCAVTRPSERSGILSDGSWTHPFSERATVFSDLFLDELSTSPFHSQLESLLLTPHPPPLFSPNQFQRGGECWSILDIRADIWDFFQTYNSCSYSTIRVISLKGKSDHKTSQIKCSQWLQDAEKIKSRLWSGPEAPSWLGSCLSAQLPLIPLLKSHVPVTLDPW